MFARALVVAVAAVLGWSLIAQGSEGAGREQSYVVRRGDTLWSIAARHYAGDPRRAVWRLQRRNGLPRPTLHVGQKLVLP